MPVARTKISRGYRARDGKYHVPTTHRNRFYGDQAMYWAKKGAKLGALALSRLNTETKYVDIQASLTQNAIVLLNGLQQGTDVNSRIGDQVKFKSLDLRAACGNTTDETIWVRYMLVRDNCANGGVPAYTDILKSASPQSFRNLDYGSRFDVFVDRTQSYQRQSTTNGYVSQPGFISIHVDLSKGKGSKNNKNITDYGLANVGNVTDISKGAYYLVLISSAVSNDVTWSMESRMKYIDN